MKLTRYPETYNPILEYWQAIQDGRETVSLKVQKTYRHVVGQLEATESEFYYSPKRANHVLEFFENYCHHSKGKAGGQLVKLELWEKALLATIFGFVDIEGNRQYHEAVLIVGKKNGKSLLASGVGLYLQMADAEAGPEVYAVATKRDQAKIIWLTAKEKLCLCEEMDCNPVHCPYAKGHYDRVNDAVYNLLQKEDVFTREVILEQAREYRVCPFEMSLDTASLPDMIS